MWLWLRISSLNLLLTLKITCSLSIMNSTILKKLSLSLTHLSSKTPSKLIGFVHLLLGLRAMWIVLLRAPGANHLWWPLSWSFEIVLRSLLRYDMVTCLSLCRNYEYNFSNQPCLSLGWTNLLIKCGWILVIHVFSNINISPCQLKIKCKMCLNIIHNIKFKISHIFYKWNSYLTFKITYGGIIFFLVFQLTSLEIDLCCLTFLRFF